MVSFFRLSTSLMRSSISLITKINLQYIYYFSVVDKMGFSADFCYVLIFYILSFEIFIIAHKAACEKTLKLTNPYINNFHRDIVPGETTKYICQLTIINAVTKTGYVAQLSLYDVNGEMIIVHASTKINNPTGTNNFILKIISLSSFTFFPSFSGGKSYNIQFQNCPVNS